MKNRHLKPKNWNEHVLGYIIVALIAAAFALAVLLPMTGCKKEPDCVVWSPVNDTTKVKHK